METGTKSLCCLVFNRSLARGQLDLYLLGTFLFRAFNGRKTASASRTGKKTSIRVAVSDLYLAVSGLRLGAVSVRKPWRSSALFENHVWPGTDLPSGNLDSLLCVGIPVVLDWGIVRKYARSQQAFKLGRQRNRVEAWTAGSSWGSVPLVFAGSF